VAPENQPQFQSVPPPAPVAPSLSARLTALLSRLHAHPIAVHTPNGVLPAATALMAAGAGFGHPGLMTAGWYNLIFVAAAMPVVLYTGYVDWQNRYRGAKTRVFRRKIISGIATAAIAGLIAPLPAVWPALLAPGAPARFLYLLLMGVNLAPAVYAGYLGGRLVFPPGKKL